MLGPIYLPAIGFPSLVWAAFYALAAGSNPDIDYFRFFTERWANRLADRLGDRENAADSET